MNPPGKPARRDPPKPPVDPLDELVAEMRQSTSKARMEFGLERPQPERVNIRVLQQLIREKPDRMTVAVKRWLRGH